MLRAIPVNTLHFNLSYGADSKFHYYHLLSNSNDSQFFPRLPLVPDGSRLEDHRRRRGRPQEDPHRHLQRDVLQAAAGYRAAGIGRPRLGQGLHRGAAAANQATDPVRAGQVRNGGFGSEITS